jgi:hypothetical protein
MGWALAAVLAASGSTPASAGDPAGTMWELEDRVKPGSEVDIVDREGRVLRGEFVRADAEGVLISVFGAAEGRRVAAADVATVLRRGDSIKNGTLIGAGIGLGMGLLLYTDPDGAENDLEPWCEGTECAGYVVAFTAMYGGIGALVDHLIKGREVVYRVPADRVSWSVTPHPVPRGAGVRLSVRF